MAQFSTTRPAAIALLACIAGGVALVVLKPRATSRTGQGSDVADVITDTRTLVLSADIIVSGTVVSEQFRGFMSGYDETTGELLPYEGAAPPAPGTSGDFVVPFTDYEIEPAVVYKDDGWVASEQPLIMRLLGEGETNVACGFRRSRATKRSGGRATLLPHGCA